MGGSKSVLNFEMLKEIRKKHMDKILKEKKKEKEKKIWIRVS